MKHQVEQLKLPVVAPKPTNCYACAHSYMGPGDSELVCGHEDAGIFGRFARRASEERGHCGPDRPKFEQHPLRNPDGSLGR